MRSQLIPHLFSKSNSLCQPCTEVAESPERPCSLLSRTVVPTNVSTLNFARVFFLLGLALATNFFFAALQENCYPLQKLPPSWHQSGSLYRVDPNLLSIWWPSINVLLLLLFLQLSLYIRVFFLWVNSDYLMLYLMLKTFLLLFIKILKLS